MMFPKTLSSSALAALLIASGVVGAAPQDAPFVGDNIPISRDAGVAEEDDANPAIAYNPDNNQYLVVWFGDRFPETEGNAFEVFGRVLDAEGTPVSDFVQISDTGPDTKNDFQAKLPDVTYNSATGE
ncbi:MAG: hypothetical protein U9R74_04405, partial [Pseudomonadota bacterium]|nr:hypothetical protein [Pseudomonadota bacterium]